MNTDLSPEAREFGIQAARAFEAAGADEWVPCNWRDTLAFWATVLAGSAGFVLILAFALGARPWTS